ncbi:MAG: metallophosphoesterase family protein [Akkermansiaceae bacterium]
MPSARTLAIGDIHGCHDALETLLDFIDLSDDDLLVTLGDYIDRGPKSNHVLDTLLELRETHQIVTLKGNHEQMIENAQLSLQECQFWMVNGGYATLDSYEANSFDDIPKRHWEFFKTCKPYLETERHIFVHAGARPDKPMDEQTDENYYWQRFGKTIGHLSEKLLICGHTPQKDGFPATKPGVVCIDTFAFGGGWLTCLDADTGQIWQANEGGETRESEVTLER